MCVGFEEKSIKEHYLNGFVRDLKRCKICFWNKIVHLKKLNGFMPEIVRGFESSKE